MESESSVSEAAQSFVGRLPELAELTQILDEASSSHGRLVLVAGEAGIGKTRLVEKVVERASAAGFLIAWGSSWQSGAVRAFWPWIQVLRAVREHDLANAIVVGNRALAALVSEPAAAEASSGQADGEGARLQLYDAIASLIGRASELRPLVIVLDDVHWADEASIRLLSFVAPLLRTMRVAVLATYREEESRGDRPLVAELPHLISHSRRIPLGSLKTSEIADLVEAVTGSTPSQKDVDAVDQRTGGNPLFVRELIRLIQAHGSLDDLAAMVTRMPVPESLHGVLDARLAVLSERCRAALIAASVLGSEFSRDVLEETTGLPSSELLDLIEEAVPARILKWADSSTAAFGHELVRDALYESLGVARRIRLHQDAGEALERIASKGRYVDPAQIAHHFVLAASAGSASKAISYSRAAGDRAMALLAYEDAASHYRRALEVQALGPQDHELRAALLLALGEARLAAGGLPEARAAYRDAAEAAQRAGRADFLARAALGMGSGASGFEVSLMDREQTDLLEKALKALPAEQSALRSWLLARLSVALSFAESEERRLALSEEAVFLARQAGDHGALAYALAAHCDAIPAPDHCGRRLEESGEIVELSSRLRDPRIELLGRRLRLVALLETGDVAGADQEIEAFAKTAALLLQPLYGWYVPLWRGMRALMEGRLEDCHRWLAEAESIGDRAHSRNAKELTITQRWVLLTESGLGDEVVELFEGLAPGESPGLWPAVAGAAGLAAAGRYVQAQARLDAAAELLPSARRDSEWLPMLAQVAETAFLIGGHRTVDWAYQALLPYRNLYAIEGIGTATRGSVERHLGLLAATQGDKSRATEHFAPALDANRRTGGTLLVARTLADAGLALDDPDRLRAALAIYRDLGVHERVQDIETRLRGHEPPTVNAFRRVGEIWALAYDGKEVRLRDSKGLRDLARLLAQPGRAVAALDLAIERPTQTNQSPGLEGLREPGDVGELLDVTARQAYKRRLAELEAELEGAAASADLGRAARLSEERDALVNELAAAYGLGGKARRPGHPAERARTAVTSRTRSAIKKIERVHPTLGRHLRRSVHTGTFCVYEPEEPVAWSL